MGVAAKEISLTRQVEAPCKFGDYDWGMCALLFPYCYFGWSGIRQWFSSSARTDMTLPHLHYLVMEDRKFGDVLGLQRMSPCGEGHSGERFSKRRAGAGESGGNWLRSGR